MMQQAKNLIYNGVNMEKNHTIQRISNKKRGRPKVRFNFMMLIIIPLLTFLTCFILYMVSANINGDFLDEDESSSADTIVTTEAVTDSEGNTLAASDNTNSSEAADTTVQNISQDGSIAYPLPQSEAADASYFENCCLITDSILLSMPKYSDFEDVIGNSALTAKSCNETTIASAYGNITAYQTMQLKKPMNLYIMLGSDIGTSTVDEMISSYTTLVTSLHNYLSETHIYLMQIPPAPAENPTITPEIVDQYNTRIMDMAKSLGVYCLDTNTALRSSDGTIADDFWSYDDSALTEEGYKTIAGYILTHTV